MGMTKVEGKLRKARSTHFVNIILVIALFLALDSLGITGAYADQQAFQSIDTKKIQNSLMIGRLVDYYEDRSAQKSVEEIEALAPSEWRASKVDIPSFGFVDSRYWIRFTLAPSSDPSSWFLEIAHPVHDVLTLYESTPQGIRKVATLGDRMPFKQRMIKTTNIVFDISTDPDREKTFWLSSKSESSMAFPLTIWDKDEFHSELVKEYAIKGFYYGMIAVMGLYNLMLFFASRQAEYLKYVLYIWSSTCFQMALTGIAFHFLWPESTWMANEGIALLAGVLGYFIVWFTQSFLNTQDYAPNLHKALHGIKVLGVSLVLFTFVGPHKIAIQMGNYLSLLTASLMLFVCIRSMYLKIPQARFFVLAFLAFFCGVVLVVFKISGLLPTNFFTAYGFQVGSALEVVLLSIAVGDKIRIQRLQASQKIQEAHIEIASLNQSLQALNQGLEKKVHEKTIDLQRRNRQIETILNSLPMGVVTLDRNLCIVQHSRWMTRFFASETLIGKSIKELLLDKSKLQADDKDIIAKAVAMMIGEDDVSFLLNEAHLPREISYITAARERTIELSWNTVLDENGLIDKILITIHDVTDTRDARAEALQKSRHLIMVGEILGIPSDRFGHFAESTSRLLDEIDSILKQKAAAENWTDILRLLHTMKGNSRTYGLSFLNNLIHQIETTLNTVEPAKIIGLDPWQQATKSSQQIRALVQEYESISQNTLNQSNDQAKDRLLLRLDQWLGKVQKDRSWRNLPDQEGLREMLQDLDRFCNLRPEELIAPLLSSLGSIAVQLRKHVPAVKIINEQRVTISKDRMHWFESVFSHLFRNSLDHGFSEQQHGTITITFDAADEKLRLVYRDDGQGLDLGTLARKYAALRPDAAGGSPEQLACLIFEDKVSSKDNVSDISGRGLGMNAVKKMVEDAAGTIRVELQQVNSKQFAPFALIIEIPLALGTQTHSRAS